MSIVKLTYTRPSRRGILGWLLLLLLVCTVYGGMGILAGVSIRGDGGGGRAQRRRGMGSTSSLCGGGAGQGGPKTRDTLIQAVESYLLSPSPQNKNVKGGAPGGVVSPSCPSPSSAIGGPLSATWRNANVMLQSVLSNGRSVACANASELVPKSVRERLRRASGGATSLKTATSAPQAPSTNNGAAPLLKDGVHCLTPLGRFLLHTRPTATPPFPTTVPSLPSVVASAVSNMLGGVVGESKGGIVKRVEESLYSGLIVGGNNNGPAAKDERENARILRELQRSLSGGVGGVSGGDLSSSSPSVPKFLMNTQKGISINKRLQLQMLGVETRGWLRALFPERMAHVSADLPLNINPNPQHHQLATAGNSPIAKYVQAAMFVINKTQTLEEEEAAKWIPTTNYISIAQHQHQLQAKLRRQWIQGGWGSKLHALGNQPPQPKIDDLESAFIASLPSSSSAHQDDHHDHHLTASNDINTNNDTIGGHGGGGRPKAILKVPLSLQSSGISMGDEGTYQGTPFTVLSNSFPRAFRLDDVLTPEHQLQYIQHAQERIERSKVVDGAAEAVDTIRTSFGMFVYNRNIPADRRFRAIASKLTGLPEENIEATQILRYTPGQYYKPHPDYFGRGSPILKRGGERVATMLAWLNDVPEGGETKFPNSLDPNTGRPLLVEPRAGSAILFYSMTEGGSTDRGSIHEAIPPVGGEKWVAVLWIREHRFT